ncbi:MAG: phycobilisome linker polypeptide [Elainellaceae cyanobacterium]
MFGQSCAVSSTSSSESSSRMFRVEVEGMGQRVSDTDRISYPIRSTGKVYLSIPYSRLNEQMQRINRMGGKILSIEPLNGDASSEVKMQATAANQNLQADGKPKSVGADEHYE